MPSPSIIERARAAGAEAAAELAVEAERAAADQAERTRDHALARVRDVLELGPEDVVRIVSPWVDGRVLVTVEADEGCLHLVYDPPRPGGFGHLYLQRECDRSEGEVGHAPAELEVHSLADLGLALAEPSPLCAGCAHDAPILALIDGWFAALIDIDGDLRDAEHRVALACATAGQRDREVEVHPIRDVGLLVLGRPPLFATMPEPTDL